MLEICIAGYSERGRITAPCRSAKHHMWPTAHPRPCQPGRQRPGPRHPHGRGDIAAPGFSPAPGPTAPGGRRTANISGRASSGELAAVPATSSMNALIHSPRRASSLLLTVLPSSPKSMSRTIPSPGPAKLTWPLMQCTERSGSPAAGCLPS